MDRGRWVNLRWVNLRRVNIRRVNLSKEHLARWDTGATAVVWEVAMEVA